jgi:hypothetical protein
MRDLAGSGGARLRLYGNLSLLEMAPVLLAADAHIREPVVIEHGGVMSLWGEDTDLPSLSAQGCSDLAANSETQALRGSYTHPDLRFIFTLAECAYRIVARRSSRIRQLRVLRARALS